MSAAGVENSVVSVRLTSRHTNTNEHTVEFMSVCLQVCVILHSFGSWESPCNLETGGPVILM